MTPDCKPFKVETFQALYEGEWQSGRLYQKLYGIHRNPVYQMKRLVKISDSLKDDPKHSIFIKKLDAEKMSY